MDDLSGLSWNSNNTGNPPRANPSSAFSGLQRPTNQSPSLSGRSTPLSGHGSNAQPKPAAPAPGGDSFANLLGGMNKSKQSNLSLQERQKQLLAEKARQDEEKRKRDAQESQFWDQLGTGTSTPELSRGGTPVGPFGPSGPKPFQPSTATTVQPNDEDDILAAFNSAAPVDNSSHYPVPTPPSTQKSPDADFGGNNGFGDDDDDPFGLNQMQRKAPVSSPPPQAMAGGDDDDVLGLLGKPVSEMPPPKPQRPRQPSPPSPNESSMPRSGPRDKAIADLVDMGFPADKAARALAQTPTGTEVQAAVGLLLNEAHEEARQKSRGPESGRGTPRSNTRGRETIGEEMDGGMPSWMQKGTNRTESNSRRAEDPGRGEDKDFSQQASQWGNKFFKQANTMWKSGQKQFQKAVADLQDGGGDPSQPKWMRDAQLAERTRASPDAASGRPKAASPELTNEAMLLEAGDSRPQKPPRPSQPRPQSREPPSEHISRGSSPGSDFGRPARSQPRFLQEQARSADRSPASRLSRQATEDATAQAYISPARRKKATPKPAEPPQDQPDIFASNDARPTATSPLQSNNPFATKSPPPAASARPARPSRPASPPRPRAPPRQIPSVSPTALSTSAKFRQQGTEAFKRGDYAAAQDAYTSALNPLPASHPITIIVLCNRALTNLKTGDPKAAMADADNALGIIGVSQGDGERITLEGGTGAAESKDMKEFFGKALSRKAEAQENLEKWADAAETWRTAVRAGVGGSVAIQGRNRCEKASGQAKPAAAAAPRPAARKPAPPKPKPAPSALADLSGESAAAASGAAVEKLRAQNAALAKADDEKFALTDAVDAKLMAWKGTKADNLRALLGSLDTVLWPEAGWKKVGMSDLVLPQKCKIVYMKAIAKVHPDKVSFSGLPVFPVSARLDPPC
jgi:hypothetical protein